LTEVVRSTAETFRPHLEANGFKFDCELPPSPISIRGDSDALSQIIVNLLSNAEKYPRERRRSVQRNHVATVAEAIAAAARGDQGAGSRLRRAARQRRKNLREFIAA